MKPTSSEYIRVRKSGIHNRGVFAKRDIPEDTKVIEYVGEKVTKKESDRRCDLHIDNHKKDTNHGAVYIFELNKKFDIDGSVSWNTAKYINHSCDPNCEADVFRGHIWITALRDIKKGEEITYDYGYDIDDWQDHPCKCGGKTCMGYIVSEDERPKLKKLIKNKKSNRLVVETFK